MYNHLIHAYYHLFTLDAHWIDSAARMDDPTVPDAVIGHLQNYEHFQTKPCKITFDRSLACHASMFLFHSPDINRQVSNGPFDQQSFRWPDLPNARFRQFQSWTIFTGESPVNSPSLTDEHGLRQIDYRYVYA
jgi:hypothetical protein